MNVKQLIDELSVLNPNLEVVVAEDEEGNGFEFLGDVIISKFDKSGMETVHPDDVDEWDQDELITVVVLWP